MELRRLNNSQHQPPPTTLPAAQKLADRVLSDGVPLAELAHGVIKLTIYKDASDICVELRNNSGKELITWHSLVTLTIFTGKSACNPDGTLPITESELYKVVPPDEVIVVRKIPIVFEQDLLTASFHVIHGEHGSQEVAFGSIELGSDKK